MIRGDSFGGLLELRCDGAMVLLKVLGVLQDAVEVFLATGRTQSKHCYSIWEILVKRTKIKENMGFIRHNQENYTNSQL